MTIQNAPGFPDRSVAAWICDDEGRAVVHIGTAAVRYPWEAEVEANPAGSGRIHHVALRCQGYDAVTRKLEMLGLDYQSNHVAGIGLRQLFIPEPNGILLELNFFGD